MQTRSMWGSVVFLAVGIGTIACGDNGGPKILPLPPGVEAPRPASSDRASLKPAQSCEDLAESRRKQMLAETIAAIQGGYEKALERSWCNPADPGGWEGGWADGGAIDVPTPGRDGDDPEHSETNNQVAGVDEADIVKTDGNYIYLIAGGQLRIVKSWPAEDTAEVARVAIQGEPKKLFVEGDRALVYSSTSSLGGRAHYSGECTYGYDCVPIGDGMGTRLSIFDISNRASPRLVRDLEADSSLLAARRIGTSVHTVLTAALGRPEVTYTPPNLSICSSSSGEIYRAYRDHLWRQIARIQAFDFESGPKLVDRRHGPSGTAVTEGPLAECSQTLVSALGDGDQLLTVLSLDIGNGSPAESSSILSYPGYVYAATDALYVAVPRWFSRWRWFTAVDGDSATAIHKFALDSENDRPTYVASGLIDGVVLNQFALDQYEDHLRVASTTSVTDGWWRLSNRVTVLAPSAENSSLLHEVGRISDLAPGEDIRAVRFDGDRGYLVTFRVSDPLYVLDLAVPSAPKYLGELHIPGFSTYIHRLDPDHLLTIGYDGDNFGITSGIALQIFDVTEPTNPQLAHKEVIGTYITSSEALTNHLAFTYHAPKGILALPMSICQYDETDWTIDMTFAGLMVFDLTAESGFSLRGQVEHPIGTYPDPYECYSWWTESSSRVERSLIIGDYVYSLSERRLKVNALDSLETDVATVTF